MHDGPIVTWRIGDPIAPAVVSDDDADAGNDDDVAPPDPPIFLPIPPLPPNPLDLDDIDVAAVAPLIIVPVDIGARYVPGAPAQGASAPVAEEEEIEGEVYDVVAAVAPLRIVPVDVGARYVQGVPALLAEEEEI